MADAKQAAIQQLNDELIEDILSGTKRSPLAHLGLNDVGVDQLTTLFPGPFNAAAAFFPEGTTQDRLNELGHTGNSPIDVSKPLVTMSIANMIEQGPVNTRNVLGHEFGHAGLREASEAARTPIGQNLQEAIMRQQDIRTGSPEVKQKSQEFINEAFVNPKRISDVSSELFDQFTRIAHDSLR